MLCGPGKTQQTKALRRSRRIADKQMKMSARFMPESKLKAEELATHVYVRKREMQIIVSPCRKKRKAKKKTTSLLTPLLTPTVRQGDTIICASEIHSPTDVLSKNTKDTKTCSKVNDPFSATQKCNPKSICKKRRITEKEYKKKLTENIDDIERPLKTQNLKIHALKNSSPAESSLIAQNVQVRLKAKSTLTEIGFPEKLTKRTTKDRPKHQMTGITNNKQNPEKILNSKFKSTEEKDTFTCSRNLPYNIRKKKELKMLENETIPILKNKSKKVKENDQIMHDTNEFPDLSCERNPEAEMKKVYCFRKQETTVGNEITQSNYVDKQPYKSQPRAETIMDFTDFDLKNQEFKPIHLDCMKEKLTNKLKQKYRTTQKNKRQKRRILDSQKCSKKSQTCGNINYLEASNTNTNKICPELEQTNDTCTHPSLLEGSKTTVGNEITQSNYVDKQPYKSQQTARAENSIDFTDFDLKNQEFKPIHLEYMKDKLTNKLKQKYRTTQMNKRQKRRILDNQKCAQKSQTSGNINYLEASNTNTNKICPELEQTNDTCTHPSLLEECKTTVGNEITQSNYVDKQPYKSQQTARAENSMDFTDFDLKNQEFKPINLDYMKEKRTNKLKQKCRTIQKNKRQKRGILKIQKCAKKSPTSRNINYLEVLNTNTNKIYPELEQTNDTCNHPSLLEGCKNKETNKYKKQNVSQEMEEIKMVEFKVSTCNDKTLNIDKIDSASVCHSKKQLNNVSNIDNIEPSLNLAKIYKEPHKLKSKNIDTQNNLTFDRSRDLTKIDDFKLEISSKRKKVTKCTCKEKNKDYSSDLITSIIETKKKDLDSGLYVLQSLSVPKSVPNETNKRENESSEIQSVNERDNVKVINDTKKMPTEDFKGLISPSANKTMTKHIPETNYQLNLNLEANLIKNNHINSSTKIKEHEQAKFKSFNECNRKKIYEYNDIDENPKAYDLDYIQSINQTEGGTLNTNQCDSKINQNIENLAFTKLIQTDSERHENILSSIQTTIDSTTKEKYALKAQTGKLTNIEESTATSHVIEKTDLTTNTYITNATLKPLSMKLDESANFKRKLENLRKAKNLTEIDLQEANYHDINKLKRKQNTPIGEEPILSNNKIKPVLCSRKTLASPNESNKIKKISNLRMQSCSIRSIENNARTPNNQMRPTIKWNSNLSNHEWKNNGRNADSSGYDMQTLESSIIIHNRNLEHNLVKAGTPVDFAPMTTSLLIEQKTSVPMLQSAIAPTTKRENNKPPINWNSISTPPDQYWNMHCRSSWLYPTSTKTVYRPRAIYPIYRKQIQGKECNVRMPYSDNSSMVSRTGYRPSKFIYPSDSIHPIINTKILNISSMYTNKNYCCLTSFSRDTDNKFESLDTSSVNEIQVPYCQTERNNGNSKPTFSNSIRNINFIETQNFPKRINNVTPPVEFIQGLDDIPIQKSEMFSDINPGILKEYLIDGAISTFSQEQSDDSIILKNNDIEDGQNSMNFKGKGNIITNTSRSPHAQENSSESTSDNSPKSDMQLSDIPSITVQRISDTLEDILSYDQSTDDLYRMLTENETIDFSP